MHKLTDSRICIILISLGSSFLTRDYTYHLTNSKKIVIPFDINGRTFSYMCECKYQQKGFIIFMTANDTTNVGGKKSCLYTVTKKSFYLIFMQFIYHFASSD